MTDRSEFFHDHKVAALAAGRRSDAKVTAGAFPVDAHATGDLTFTAIPLATEVFTFNGTAFTLIANGATPVGNQIALGTNLTTTLDAMAAALNASAVAGVALATYSNVGGTKLHISYDAVGTAGNAYTLVEAGSTATASGATLTGGGLKDADDFDLSAETYGIVTQVAGGKLVLPNGDQGQEVTLYLDTKNTSNAVVTGVLAGGTTATFDTVGDFIKLKWLKDKWAVLTNSSVTVA